jgi:hypothetical protein
MDDSTISYTNIDTRLPTSPSHSYGTLTATSLDWNTAGTKLTVTLGSGETIVGGETVNPSSDVKSAAGLSDATAAPGPAIPTTPTPTLNCFIATAAYGTSTAEEIDVLRAFRDEVLLESTVGSQLVEWYYQTSPPVADFISENSLLRTIVRELVIDPMVSVATFTQGIWGK